MPNIDNIITKFLDYNYYVGIDNNGFTLVDLNNDEKLTTEEFKIIIQKVFSFDVFDNSIPYNWVKNKQSLITKEFNNYFSKLEIRLGSRNWEVIKVESNTIVSQETVIKELVKETGLDIGFVKLIFNKWFDDNTLIVSEKLMNNYN